MKKAIVLGMILMFFGAGIVSGFDINLITRNQPLSRDWLYVGGPGPYLTIQSAVDAAQPGDTVFVFNGTYYEHVVIDKTLYLIGQSPEITFIDGSGTGIVVNVKHDAVSIKGFTIQHGPTNDVYKAGIYITESKNCSITWNKFTLNVNCNSIYLTSNSDRNNITHNTFENNYCDIYVNSKNNLISYNSITNNHNCGIRIFGDNNNISNNVISSCFSSAVDLKSKQNIVQKNIIGPSNQWGITIDDNSCYNYIGWNEIEHNHRGIIIGGINNHIENNTIRDNDDGIDISLQSSDNIICYNIIKNNYVGIWTRGQNDLIYNNYFNNALNAHDVYGKEVWNIDVRIGTNIQGGPLLGGNYWSDYPYWYKYHFKQFSWYDPNSNWIVNVPEDFYPIPTDIPGVYAQDNHPIPGFELVFVIGAIAVTMFLWRKKRIT